MIREDEEDNRTNEENRLVIDQDDPQESINPILNLADVGRERARCVSRSASPSLSISPESLPISGSSRFDNTARSGTESPADAGTPAGDQDLANSPVLTIACGYLTAKLYMDRFYCPGIHQLCIEYNGQFLTPKQFTIVAAKDKQKDWKGAIKVNRQPIRILFERNLLDFYKHNEYCSGRCVSKSYKPLGDPSISSPVSSAVDLGQHNTNHIGTIFTDGVVGRAAVELAAFANGLVVKKEVEEMVEEEKEQRQYSNGRKVNVDVAAVLRNVNGLDLTNLNGSLLMHAEPVLYWNCVSHLGLFHELIQEIEQQVQILKASFGITELRNKAAKKLSELVRVLDIGDRIQEKLIAKRTYADAQCALLATELTELRKIAETQEKKQRDAKRKSELLDHLIGTLQDQKRKRRENSGSTPINLAPAEPSPIQNLPNQ